MAVEAIIILICTTVLVVTGFPEPPKKQTGYGYSVHTAQENNKRLPTYGANEDQGYGDEEYGRVPVKKYGYKKEYEKEDRKYQAYEPSEGYHKPRENSGYRSDNYDSGDRKGSFPYHQDRPNTYKPRGYDDRSQFEPHRFTAQRGYGDDRNQKSVNRPSKPQPIGYNRNRQTYDNSHTSQPRGYEDDHRRQNQPHKSQGYPDDSVQGYRPQNPHVSGASGYSENRGYGPVREPYQQREEKKYYKGYHKEEYHHNNDNMGYSNEPTYGTQPDQDLSKKKVIYEKHYYGQFGNGQKQERALGGFEGDLHAPVYRPHDETSGYQDNRQLRGYEAAFARHKYYQLAPHYNH